MASGLVCRANRPNTWLHRPATQREDFPCQLGAVHTWHFASDEPCAQDVRFLGIGGLAVDANSTRMTPTGHWPVRNPALRQTPDLMLANSLCCHAG